jgi:hypothetical protein
MLFVLYCKGNLIESAARGISKTKKTVVAALLKDFLKIPFKLEVLDIHKDECPKELADRYMFDIPVVHLNNEFLVQHRIPEDRLVDALKKYGTTGKVEKI